MHILKRNGIHLLKSILPNCCLWDLVDFRRQRGLVEHPFVYDLHYLRIQNKLRTRDIMSFHTSSWIECGSERTLIPQVTSKRGVSNGLYNAYNCKQRPSCRSWQIEDQCHLTADGQELSEKGYDSWKWFPGIGRVDFLLASCLCKKKMACITSNIKILNKMDWVLPCEVGRSTRTLARRWEWCLIIRAQQESYGSSTFHQVHLEMTRDLSSEEAEYFVTKIERSRHGPIATGLDCLPMPSEVRH